MLSFRRDELLCAAEAGAAPKIILMIDKKAAPFYNKCILFTYAIYDYVKPTECRPWDTARGIQAHGIQAAGEAVTIRK